ncbi:unnamed protein product, partial [Prorocentrum cordatum]
MWRVSGMILKNCASQKKRDRGYHRQQISGRAEHHERDIEEEHRGTESYHQGHVFSTTVVSVMSNALLTFAEFSCVVHRLLRSVFVRGAIVVAAEAALVAVVATLPYALEANGGVWTLFVVQSPGVFLATALATILARRAALADNPALRDAVRLASTAGALLSTAMVLSFVECSIGFEHGFFPGWWGFPWLHICIHLLEQVGIYIFGVGIAALDAALADPAQEG